MGPAEQQLAYSEYLSRNQREWMQTGLKIGELATNARIATRQQDLRERMFEFEKEQQPQKSRLISTQIDALEQRMRHDTVINPKIEEKAVLELETFKREMAVADATSQYFPEFLKVLDDETSENRARVSQGQEPAWDRTNDYLLTKKNLAQSQAVLRAREGAKQEIRAHQQYGIGETQELVNRSASLRSQAAGLEATDPNNLGLAQMLRSEADLLEEHVRNRYSRSGYGTTGRGTAAIQNQAAYDLRAELITGQLDRGEITEDQAAEMLEIARAGLVSPSLVRLTEERKTDAFARIERAMADVIATGKAQRMQGKAAILNEARTRIDQAKNSGEIAEIENWVALSIVEMQRQIEDDKSGSTPIKITPFKPSTRTPGTTFQGVPVDNVTTNMIGGKPVIIRRTP